MNAPAPAGPGSYREPHSALNKGLLTYGLLPLSAEIGCLIIGVVANLPWFFVLMGPLFVLLLISASLLYRNWPTGIQIDESGISIGAVRSARSASRRPTVNHQGWGLFTCPWSAVQDLRIVTDRDELQQLKTAPRYYTLTNRWSNKAGVSHCNIGVLASPFMRAALIIEVNPFAATASQVRPARYYSNFKDGRFSHLVHPQLSPTWVVPTRHPEALGAVLRAVPGGQRSR
jgi:hypothetical protein